MQETSEIRSLAREFAAAELRPHTERWDTARELDADVAAKLAELGFFGMLLAEADGGMGFGMTDVVAALEELAWGEASVALMVAHNIAAADLLAHSSDGSHRATLTQLATGERMASFTAPPLPELEAAADGGRSGTLALAPLGATAALFIIPDGDNADRLLIATPGAAVRPGEPVDTLGLRPLAFTRLELERAPTTVIETGAPVAHLTAAAVAVGIAQAALEHAVRYAGEREQFAQPIRRFEGVQVRLADMATRTMAARALVQGAAARPGDVLHTAVAKYAAADAAMRVTTDAVQVFGGYGYMRDYPVEKLMRDARAMAILHGPNQEQRRRIADALYAE